MNGTLKGMNNIFMVNMLFVPLEMLYIQYCGIVDIFMLVFSQEVIPRGT
jgi:hypothetical protein